MRILGREDVAAALDGLDPAVLDAVRTAYVLHGQGRSEVPFSGFLRPPGDDGSRIISLPAYLGGPEPVMGLKWISSFPANVERGLQRASSVQILNDLRTGYPTAVLEASQISASRTAASAALASRTLHGDRPVHTAGLIGCGTINRRVLDFLVLVHPELRTVTVQDAVPGRAATFAAQMAALRPEITFVAGDVDDALRAGTVSVATTDSTYWLDLAAHPDRPADQVILHLSLRDLSTDSVLNAYNVVDDIEHVMRERTSLHRAEQEVGHRRFVDEEIATVLGRTEAPVTGRTVVFSPFGLGILDLAVARTILAAATRHGIGSEAEGFDPGVHRVTAAMAGGAA
ncbi:2,3-diaminopropionate biosynthesis protein SbnB [Streptomyces sp. NE06-03E]|uniref:2,3-diaminopropionate biosynthesis protein SbnB n=2 Tax=Streptomyces TaxID=1883 RepID=A0A652LBK2_9ACTN|nr:MULTISPECIES: 2,3-diaminopropionate biosynthesis protein SbnB [unclassified Streptomyces]WSS63151.1 2,3-diaminopropionate biosynthesis protein SbnB [Streptomyces sp. NBC_01177]WSS70165.1 2,3-diaminopropionate biosynthesis protein SbnB [Streptomyces sp. NBC_01175]WSS77165.1 2,3-diaminopropionate biosynthesis protein SbnB [Streptomyces sp. NBC_01174]MDX3056878.1 2,3-diaminopropionate biosynthesis protein SbnB [Streptomyces sp. NE06-03E]MDX3327283.1 2,3-diaminopropionate biosynthesis protein S